jgi:ABC-2 type transport system permease protein
MSTGILTTPAATSSQGSPPADDVRLTFPRIVRSEWVKFATLRSTVWTLATTLLVIVGISTLFSAILASGIPDGNAGNVDGTGGASIFSVATNLAQLAVVVLGVLIISGEYSTGMVRSTLVAVPRRLPALCAKGVVLAASILVVSTVAVGISLGAMQLFLGAKGLTPDLGDAGTVRVLVGVPLYLTAIALLAFAIGALLRHSAGALATVLGLLLVIENLFLIPWKPLELVGPFLPGTAGSMIVMPQAQLDLISQGSAGAVLGPWQGYGVLLAWVVVLLATAALLLRHRDA